MDDSRTFHEDGIKPESNPFGNFKYLDWSVILIFKGVSIYFLKNLTDRLAFLDFKMKPFRYFSISKVLFGIITILILTSEEILPLKVIIQTILNCQRKIFNLEFHDWILMLLYGLLIYSLRRVMGNFHIKITPFRYFTKIVFGFLILFTFISPCQATDSKKYNDIITSLLNQPTQFTNQILKKCSLIIERCWMNLPGLLSTTHDMAMNNKLISIAILGIIIIIISYSIFILIRRNNKPVYSKYFSRNFADRFNSKNFPEVNLETTIFDSNKCYFRKPTIKKILRIMDARNKIK